MDPLWDFFYGLPNKRYLEFVRRFILMLDGDDQTSPTVDPFAIDLPAEFVDRTYIVRELVMSEIGHPATWLILGETGIGKTTIWAKLLSQTDESVLTVGLDLHRADGELFKGDILSGKTSFLAPALLIPRVFEAFWEKTILSVQRRDRYLHRLRADRRWMELLRWFYRRYPPSHPPVDDHELMAWLNVPAQAEPLRDQLPPFASLSELLRLITWSVSQKSFDGLEKFFQVYTKVLVLLDGTRQLSAPAVRRLVEDAQSLYDMDVDNLRFKLFIDMTWEPQIAGMDCVRQGRTKVFILPPWSERDLSRLLRLRVYSFQVGGSTTDAKKLPEYNLGNMLADSGAVGSELRECLESLIVNSSQGIPLHTLRLARCVVGACAGCWAEEFQPPLGRDDIRRLIALYQKHIDLIRQANPQPYNKE